MRAEGEVVEEEDGSHAPSEFVGCLGGGWEVCEGAETQGGVGEGVVDEGCDILALINSIRRTA